MKTKIYYPAVFCKEEEGGFSILFPDLPGCGTQSETIQEGMELAQEALYEYITACKENSFPIPQPSAIESIDHAHNDFVIPIEYNRMKYDRKYYSKAVRKNITIPEWLSILADEHDLSLSEATKVGLKMQLGL